MNSEKPTNGDELLAEKVGRMLRVFKWVAGIIGGLLAYFYPLTIVLVWIAEGVSFGNSMDWFPEVILIILFPAEWLYETWPFYENSLNFFLEPLGI